ncbi:MAG: NUDIX domain-containing protein [Clostridia bacterium]|nr:NUDIX domain-containing protein [Clostridia bacterium]
MSDKNYTKENSKKIDRFALSTDLLIFSISRGEAKDCRSLSDKFFSILLVKRNKEPFKGMWCLPGGFVKDNETLDMAADRVLTKETNLHNIYKEQLYTFGDLNRDPRMRVITTAYMALIDKERLTDELSGEASWFNIAIEEKTNETKIRLDNGNDQIVISLKRVIEDETTTKYKYEIIQNDNIAFDHVNILMTGLDRIKNKVRDTDIVFNLMPEYFTLGELQQIYEVILGKKLLDPAFRRIIADKVIKTDKTIKTGGHRPSAMYKYKRK